jgi:predicted acetylornithine/succinylornithine family transaminase
MTDAERVRSLEAQHIVQTYRRASIVIERGEGSWVYDADGRKYLDLISGIGVASLGHANPRLRQVLDAQAATLLHTSNLFYHPLQGELAARLAGLSGLPRAFFCNSGTEAVEACLKFARRFWHGRPERPRTEIVALEHAFHGRTCGSLSMTWDEHYRAPFEPLLPDVRFIPANDVAALRTAVTGATAAVIVEPVQGEGGVRPLSAAFAAVLAETCARTGALLIADEVQCGLGRTGYPFYSSALGLKPDLMALGKALGAGVPIGAALASERVAGGIAFGDHGSTYGGNLLACSAALCFIDTLVSGGLIAHVARAGTHLERGLRELARRHPMVVDVRGAGLMWGIELSVPAAPVVETALARGVLINRTADTVVRLLPALTVTEAELDHGLAVLDETLAATGAGVAA